MFDLKYASMNLRKAARLEGFRSDRRNAYFIPVTDNENGVKAIVGDNRGEEIRITVFDIEYAAQFAWAEL